MDSAPGRPVLSEPVSGTEIANNRETLENNRENFAGMNAEDGSMFDRTIGTPNPTSTIGNRLEKLDVSLVIVPLSSPIGDALVPRSGCITQEMPMGLFDNLEA